MLDGQWNLHFISTFTKIDAGVIEFADNKFHGGDANYQYLGDVDLNEDVLVGELRATTQQNRSHTIFGHLQQFRILLHGKVQSSFMDLTGYLADNPSVKIKVEGTRIK